MTTTPYPFPRELRQSDVLSGDGTPGPFGPSTFKVFDVEDVQVFVKAADADAFTLTEEVTVTKTADEAFDTFSITFDDDLPETTEWLYQAARTQTRALAVTRGGAINATELERELSKLGTIVSELRRDIDRAWLADFGGTAGRFEAIAEGHFWKADADGNAVDGGDADDIAGAQTAAATATTKAAEAAASAVAAAASAAEAEGDVSGPASAVDGRIAVYDGTTGKLIKVGSVAISDLATAAQGALAETSLQIDDLAAPGDYRAGTADKVLDTTAVWGDMAEVTLAFASPIAWDMSTGFDFTVTLTANGMLDNPTGTQVGKRGRIRVVQDGTGGWTLTKSSNHKTAGGAALTIASAAGAETYIYYDCVAADKVLLSNSPLAWS